MLKKTLREIYVDGGKEFTGKNLCDIITYLNLDLTVSNLKEEYSILNKEVYFVKYLGGHHYTVEDLLDEIDKLSVIEDERFVYTCSGECCQSTYGTFKEAFEDLVGTNSAGAVYKHEPFSFGEDKPEYKVFEVF